MKRRQALTTAFSALGLLLMMGFQNCAPTGAGVVASVGGDVRIVDRWQSEKISFPVNLYYVDSNVDNVNIEGLCDQSKGIVDVVWKAVTKGADSSTVTVSSGVSGCQAGSFNVALEKINAELSDCSQQVEVSASVNDGSGEEAKALLKKQCF